MSVEINPITLKILGKEYKVACAQDECNELLHSAQMLDQQMREIQDSGKVIGPDRIAVMAALNLTHELNQLQKQSYSLSDNVEAHLHTLCNKIENVLASA